MTASPFAWIGASENLRPPQYVGVVTRPSIVPTSDAGLGPQRGGVWATEHQGSVRARTCEETVLICIPQPPLASAGAAA
jgi:hypothetical protein